MGYSPGLGNVEVVEVLTSIVHAANSAWPCALSNCQAIRKDRPPETAIVEIATGQVFNQRRAEPHRFAFIWQFRGHDLVGNCRSADRC